MGEIRMTIDLPVHPSTGLLALGLRRNGAPIWPVLGGSEDAAEDASDSGEEPEETKDDPAEGDQDGEDKPLGPAGEKALQAEKDKRRAAAATARAEKARADVAEAELAKLRKAAEKTTTPKNADPDEVKVDPEEIQREADAKAIAKANDRIVRAEVKVAATGRLADPADALAFLDLTQFEVDDDGNVDEDEVRDAITNLLKKKPHLAAQGGRRFQGGGDGGAKPKTPAARPTSLSEATNRHYAKS
jgi:hypothetical protein